MHYHMIVHSQYMQYKHVLSLSCVMFCILCSIMAAETSSFASLAKLHHDLTMRGQCTMAAYVYSGTLLSGSSLTIACFDLVVILLPLIHGLVE